MIANNIASKLKDTCCGCGACAVSCPKSAIQMIPDCEGFEYPKVDQGLCIDCGLCLKSCPFEVDKTVPNYTVLDCYSGYCIDESAQTLSSSGGAATTVSKAFIEKGGIVYGSAFSSDCKTIEVRRITSARDLSLLRGSKYAQTRKVEAYRNVIEDLKTGMKVLYIGLPCEIAALKCIVKADANLFTAELICSGITSQSVHRQFVEYIEKNCGKKITSFTYRNKSKGWHWPSIQAYSGDSLCYDRPWYASIMGYAFKTFMRHSCYNCQFKEKYNKADITLGDFWGLGKDDPRYSSRGVSAIIIHTEKGKELLKGMPDFRLDHAGYDEIRQGNPRLNSCLAKPAMRDKFGSVFERDGLLVAYKACRGIKDIIKDLVKLAISHLNK